MNNSLETTENESVDTDENSIFKCIQLLWHKGICFDAHTFDKVFQVSASFL